MASAKSKTKEAAEQTPAIVAYKGFDKNLQCRGYQFELGKTFEHVGRVEACSSGFHACENPFDVWSYYGPVGDDGHLHRFARVSLSGSIVRHSEDSKIAAGRITLDAELRLPDFLAHAIKWVIDATALSVKATGAGDLTDKGGDSAKIGSSGYSAKIGSSGDSAKIGSSGDYAKIGSSGYYAQIGSSGYSAKIGSSGDYAKIGSSGYSAKIGSSGYSAQIGSSGYSAQIGSSGDYAQIGSSGDYAKIGSSGDSAKIGSSGDSAKIGSSGDYAQIGSSGYYAQIGSSGDSAQIGSSGDYAQIEATGANAVVACAGVGSTVKAGPDGAICIPWHDGKRTRFVVGYVGEDGIKAGVFYRCVGGKLVEATGQ